MIRCLFVSHDGIKEVRKVLSGKSNIQGVNDYSIEKMPNAAKSKYGNLVIAYEPTAEFVQACHPVPVMAVCASKEYEAPEGSIRVINGPTVAANTMNAIRKFMDIISERNLTTFSVVPLDDDEDDAPIVVAKKEVKIDPNIIQVDPMSGAMITPGSKSLEERIEDAKNNPAPAKVAVPKLSRGLGGKIQIGEHPIPAGTKMVSINYKGANCHGEIVLVDGELKIQFNGKTYGSLTECSDQATLDVMSFVNVDPGNSYKGEKNKARTTGTRFWFPEDVPANAFLRGVCAKKGYPVQLTDGIKWSSSPMTVNPNGAPKRGRKAKPKVATVATVPATVAVETEKTEADAVLSGHEENVIE